MPCAADRKGPFVVDLPMQYLGATSRDHPLLQKSVHHETEEVKVRREASPPNILAPLLPPFHAVVFRMDFLGNNNRISNVCVCACAAQQSQISERPKSISHNPIAYLVWKLQYLMFVATSTRSTPFPEQTLSLSLRSNLTPHCCFVLKILPLMFPVEEPPALLMASILLQMLTSD